MIHLFYVVGLIAIALEVQALLNPKKMIAFAEPLNAELDRAGKKEEVPNLSKKQGKFILWEVGYVLWLIVGIFITPYWGIFGAIIAMSFIPKKKAWWVRTDSILTILLFAFVLIDHFVL